MNELKLLWTDIGGVSFKGKGIIEAWREEMACKGWVIETDPAKWEECDLVFYGSDSQLYHVPEPLGKKPTILYFWGWEHGRLLDRKFKEFAAGQLEKMAQCTRILAPSLITMYQIADFGLSCHLCLPGVDSRSLDVAPPMKREPKILFLSRLVPHKHLDSLIVALAHIEPAIELNVVGPGDRTRYEELAQALGVNAKFMELTDVEKAQALRTSILLVHPSEYEGFGLPPLEALYCRTPVAAFDIPQHRWLFKDNAYYFQTVEELTNTIVHVFEHQDEAFHMAARGQAMVKNELILERACDRLWAHIHQVIKEHLATELRTKPEQWSKIYDNEHKRNWAYSIDRFDPTWARHWRAQAYIDVLKHSGVQKILDVGCGAVYPTIFARNGFDVHAVDISPECLKQVEEIATRWGVKDKITTHCADAADLSSLQEFGPFDAVMHGEIWEHVPDVESIVLEGIRMLKPHGKLIATTPIGSHHYDPMHLRVFTRENIIELINNVRIKSKVSLEKLEEIAEGDSDPSCFFIVLEKWGDGSIHGV